MSEELLRWRREFPGLESSTWLISNSLGAMPRGVRTGLEAYADAWQTRGVRSWEEGWWELPVAVGDEIAGIVGAPPGSVSTHQNVTLASAIAASCFEFREPRDRVVCSELNFPSILYLYRQMERRGACLEIVPSADGLTVPLEALLEAIDERTLLVPISHVIFKSAFVQDVRAVVERAHEVGAHVILDVYQSAGVLPVELESWGVDMAVGGVLKWLCGGPGVAYLYVRPDLAERLEPALTGWMAHPEPFDFDPGPIRYRAGGWRFLNGTPHVPSLHAARPGLRILGRLDLAAVRANSLRQTDRIIDFADEQGWEVNSPRDHQRRGGTVSLGVPGAEAITRELLARDILVDYRPGVGIRVSPHFYNTDEEIEHGLATIAHLAERTAPAATRS